MREDIKTTETGQFSSLRRDVMKAVGAGGALGVLGGTATAGQHQQQNGTESTPEEPTGDDGVMENTVHVVRTLVGPSTNPERPADFFYQPTGIHVEPGDVIKYVAATPDHNVTSYHPVFGMQRRIPADADPFSSPILGWEPDSLPEDADEPPAMEGMPGEPGADDGNGANGGGGEQAGDADAESGDGPEPSTWLHAFGVPGVYDIECAPHEGFGMTMRVVVGDETETDFETSDPEALPEPRLGPVGFARAVLTDPNLQPDAIVDAGRVEWMDLQMNQSDGAGTGMDGTGMGTNGTNATNTNGTDMNGTDMNGTDTNET